MKDFFSAKKNIILAAIIVGLALMVILWFLGKSGLMCNSCNNMADGCNVISCVADGCVACTNCVGCMVGCE